MKWLLDPMLFNVLILVLFAAASVRWAIAGDWKQALYWFAAFWLNVAVSAMAQPGAKC
jgi:hypothetical protein